MLVSLLGIFVSLLPKRYRGRYLGDASLDIKRGAILSGAAEIVFCALALWLRYPAFIHARMSEAAAAVTAKHGQDQILLGVSQFSSGTLGLFEYIIQPLSLLLLYLLVEGSVRVMAAVATEEVVPSLPLQAIAWLHGFGVRQQHEISLGPRLVDVVQPGKEGQYDLLIESSRPKLWDHLLTISYQDQLYELARELPGPPPRRFVYLLRKAPAHKIIRGLHQYDPAENLQKSASQGPLPNSPRAPG